MKGLFFAGKASAFALSLAFSAPVQCGSKVDPEMRLEDTAGDALWALADTFEQEGDTAARDRTLRYLVERYPSNRHASAARERLGQPAKR